mmetsp:Transcript_33193/g.91489  ORF Transcript_33193/g.91489 Transcript_33193/m.91489 type:complete len:911 (-) Transcript_33193:91-2823(-)
MADALPEPRRKAPVSSPLSWHGTVAPGIISCVASCPRFLLGVYVVITIVAAWHAPFLFDKLSTDSSPPDGYPSAVAANELRTHFGEQASSITGILYIRGPRSFVEDQSLEAITLKTKARFEATSEAMPYACVVTGYHTLVSQHLNGLAEEYLSESKTESFISVSHSPDTVDSEKLGRELIKFADELKRDSCCGHLWIGASGLPVIDAESSDAAVEDLMAADLIVIPLAMSVLAVMISSWRLLVVTLLNFAIAISLAFSVVYVLASNGLSTSAAAPGLMQSVLIAVSVDYSLFMLTRFVEELKMGTEYQQAVEASLMSAGHTVLGSGGTLMFCFIALCAFPVAFLRSLSLGVVFAIFFAIFVNLTLTPVLLLAFPSFFGRLGWGCGCRGKKISKAADQQGTELADVEPKPGSRAYALSQATTKRWTTIVVTLSVLGIVVGLAPYATSIKTTANVSQEMARGGDAIAALQSVVDAFGGGVANPYSVLFVPDVPDTARGGAIFREDFWKAVTRSLEELPAYFPHSGRNAIVSPMYRYNSPTFGLNLSTVPLGMQIELWRQCHVSFDQRVPDSFPSPAPCVPGPDCCSKAIGNRDIMELFHLRNETDVYKLTAMMVAVLAETTNVDGSALRAHLLVDFAPGVEAGCDFVRVVRGLFGKDLGPVRAWLGGGDGINKDMLDAINASMMQICGATMAVVLLIIGLLYRSVMIPVRGIVTILTTQIVAFATLTFIFTNGALDGLGIAAWKGVGGVYFLIPPMTFTIVLGLSLDYDVFLIGRIVEFRKEGYSDDDSIVLGVWKTSGIITAAGAIMAIAFSGLLFSRMYLMNEFGTVLVVAVMLDTLFLRAVATPAMMAPLGRLNWWPHKMPQPTRRAGDYFAEEQAQAAKRNPPGTPASEKSSSVSNESDSTTGEETMA